MSNVVTNQSCPRRQAPCHTDCDQYNIAGGCTNLAYAGDDFGGKELLIVHDDTDAIVAWHVLGAEETLHASRLVPMQESV